LNVEATQKRVLKFESFKEGSVTNNMNIRKHKNNVNVVKKALKK
jgi:hypothetical protein